MRTPQEYAHALPGTDQEVAAKWDTITVIGQETKPLAQSGTNSERENLANSKERAGLFGPSGLDSTPIVLLRDGTC